MRSSKNNIRRPGHSVLQMKKILFFIFFIFICKANFAAAINDLHKLKRAYPEAIFSISEQILTWQDGSEMPVQEGAPSLADQIVNVKYGDEISDAGRTRYQPFFLKMYGESKEEVEKNLLSFFWMPQVFGHRYPLLATTVNDVYEKLLAISSELEALPPAYYPYLDNPSGTYRWRHIAHTQRLSLHSFGIAIDLNTSYSHYWQWDLKKEGRPISESEPLIYRNHIPMEIVGIFEKHGFIWGGRWQHYDTMHFEYRPELLI